MSRAPTARVRTLAAMSRTAAVVALIVALILGGVAVLTLSTPGGGPNMDGPSEAVFAFQPSEVQSLRVAPAGQDVSYMVERASPGGWRLRTFGSGDTRPWPVVPTRARGAVRVLADLAAPVDQDAAPTLDDRAVTLEVTLRDGKEHRLEIGSEAVGGRRRAVTGDGRVMYVDASVLDVLTNPGPPGWRNPAALPGVGAETSRIAIRAPETALTLARVEGDWRLRSPVRARASDSAVSDLVGALAALRATSFLTPDEAPPATEMGLDEPELVITIESDQRRIGPDGEVTIETARRRLRLGGPARLGGGGRFADTGEGGQAMVVDASGIDAIQTDPALYPARTAIGARPSGIGMVIVMPTSGSDRGYRRTIDGWRRIADDGGLAPVEDEVVESLLTFLSERLASDVLLREPSDVQPVAIVRLLDLADGPLGRVEVGEAAEGVAVRTDDVTRMYAGASLPSLLTESEEASSLAGAGSNEGAE